LDTLARHRLSRAVRTGQEMHDGFAVLLHRRKESAGPTPGRPDEGVWAYACDLGFPVTTRCDASHIPEWNSLLH